MPASSSDNSAVIAGVVAAVSVMLIIGICLFCVYRGRRRREAKEIGLEIAALELSGGLVAQMAKGDTVHNGRQGHTAEYFQNPLYATEEASEERTHDNPLYDAAASGTSSGGNPAPDLPTYETLNRHSGGNLQANLENKNEDGWV